MMEQVERQQSTNSLEEAYLQKRIKNKKIAYLVVSIVTFVLACAIVIMACVNVDLRPQFIKNPNEITIYTDEVPSGFILINDENENKFNDIYSNMFKLNVLSALFSGNFGNYNINETMTRFPQADTSEFKEMFGKNYVKFVFNEPQNLYNKNGTKYQSQYSSEGYNITFTEVYFSYDNDNMTKDLTFYFAVEGNISKPNKTVTKLTISANVYPIYELVELYK